MFGSSESDQSPAITSRPHATETGPLEAVAYASLLLALRFALRPCGRLQCLLSGNRPTAVVHIVNVESGIGDAEQQAGARAAGTMDVMTGQRGVGTGRELERLTVLHLDHPLPADDQHVLIRGV